MKKLPIIYSKRYDIGLWGLEKQHPFDTKKYGKVYRYLVRQLGIDKRRFYRPHPVTQQQLLSVHTWEYLQSLKQAATIAQIAEFPALRVLPSWLLDQAILKPMRYATGGTILGVDLALEHGWAINLAGGYHHAKGNSGEGFCYYADIPIAVFRALKRHPSLSILIVDLDVHQGNGCADLFKFDANVHLLDVYNCWIYPCDRRALSFVDFNTPVSPSISDALYLALVSQTLRRAIHRCRPNLIIYNAGTDVLIGDPLGGMQISEPAIVLRDELVFRQALKHDIPVLMLLAGGYTSRSAVVIAHSIENLLKNLLSFE